MAEDVVTTPQLALRGRLKDFIRAELTPRGRVRSLDPFENWTVDEALTIAHYAAFLWLTFNDGESPRAVGIRYLGQSAGLCSYEVAQFIQPTEVVVSRWRVSPEKGWRRVAGDL